ncbi:hypothetical protein FRC12_010944 [Ceratobasidium sp. 428]|nr:hypothetical protein FRC12_010944 [Ceratobasidium sp. 428]
MAAQQRGVRKNPDGYFYSWDVPEQFKMALEIVKEEYPNEEHLSIFDSAAIHTKLPDDAPSVALMMLWPSKHVKVEAINTLGQKNQGQYGTRMFKGLTKLLEERGIPDAQNLKL